MGSMPWRVLIFSLQMTCILLFTSMTLLFLFQENGNSDHLRMAFMMQDFAQLSLLLAGLLPVVLEDLLGPGRKSPPGS